MWVRNPNVDKGLFHTSLTTDVHHTAQAILSEMSLHFGNLEP